MHYPAHLIRTIELDDGRHVIVRPVLPQDAELEARFVAGLSAQARRWRFHGAVKGLGAAAAERLTCIDYRAHLALVAVVVGDDDAETLVADARYVAEGDCAEFAIVVHDDWSGRGLARRLMALLADCARRAGLRWLRGDVLAGNAPMLGLMQRLGFHVSRERADGTVSVERALGERIAVARRPRGWRAALAAWLLGAPVPA